MTSPDNHVRISCIVPAAGSSRRMGCPKAALPFGGSTVAGTVVRSLLRAGADEILVVTRRELAAHLDLPPGPAITVAFNDDPNSEMIDSVRIALAFLQSRAGEHRVSPGASGAIDNLPPRFAATGILVVPADMPAITVESYRKCLDSFHRDPGRIVIAAYQGKSGHPIVFPISLAADVGRLTGGLREMIHANSERVILAETNDPGVLRDVDTRADYERMNQR